MNHKLLLSMCLLAPAALAAAPLAPSVASAKQPFRYAYKSAQTLKQEDKSHRECVNKLLDPSAQLQKATAIEPTASLPSSGQFGYLDGPDGTPWYYTSEPVVEEVPVAGGYEGLTEKIIREFKYTVYNSELKVMGTIRDKVEADPDALETKPVQVMLNSVVSKKFFNVDDKYELIVSVAMNRDLTQNPYPTVNYHSYVYSLGGKLTDEGYNEKVKTFEGYLVGSVNSAPDRWAENYFMTFMKESADLNLSDYDEFNESCKFELTTYSRATYGGDMNVFQKRDVKLNRLPGDQMNAPFLLTGLHNGKACFTFMEYEKKFYSTQGAFDPSTGELSDPEQNPDNNLLITIYEDNGGSPVELQTTRIPVVIDKTTDKALFTYYAVGNMLYDSDVDFGNFLADSSKACFIVNKQVYLAGSDDYLNNYYVYDPEGEVLMPLSEGCSSFIEMSDVKGFDPQIAFVYYTGDEYKLSFVDLYTGDEAASMGQTVNGNMISSSLDRVPYGDSYRYAMSMLHASTDEQNNVIHTICWLDDNAKFLSEEKLNFGPDVQYAVVYMDQSTLNPYLFDTDAEHEYMALVKRFDSSAHTSLEEALLVVSANGSTLLDLGPDSDKGVLVNISPVLYGSAPRLNVVYRSDDYKYLPEFYNLPLAKFSAGGDGSVENPYLIATAGDLQQISSNLGAHYKLIKDIDASNTEFKPASSAFTGSLDGDGHTISNLSVAPNVANSGFFGRLEAGSFVKNLNIVNAVVEVDENVSRAGVIAAEAMDATIENVHVYNAQVTNADEYDSTFGGLVGNAMVRTKISGSSVANADFSLPQASVGGLVGSIRTGVTLDECSFSGKISGATEVGGIAGSSITGDERISDCHVDADITAENTVGGIIGSSRRSTIERCYVEGSIEATKANRWNDNGPCAGGIVGLLAAGNVSSEGLTAQAPAASGTIINNVVRLESLKGYASTGNPEFAQERTTMHRIVGWTRYNTNPEDGQTPSADEGLSNNYSVASLDKVDADVADALNSTEGKSISDDDMNREFFENEIGMKFGDTEPWNEISDTDPTLNHETGAFFNPSVINPEEGTKFEAVLVIVSRVQLSAEEIVSDFSCDSSDEEVATPTGQFRLEGNNLIIEFECGKVGTAEITAYVNGASAKCTVSSVESGVNEVVVGAENAISYNGTTLSAEGCALTLYNVAGTAVASSRDALSVQGLQKGIYVAVAVAADGHRSVLKVLVK